MKNAFGDRLREVTYDHFMNIHSILNVSHTKTKLISYKKYC